VILSLQQFVYQLQLCAPLFAFRPNYRGPFVLLFHLRFILFIFSFANDKEAVNKIIANEKEARKEN
jgi:hypothetical protein